MKTKKSITKPAKKNSIIDLVEKLSRPTVAPKADIKEAYYFENAKKYGF